MVVRLKLKLESRTKDQVVVSVRLADGKNTINQTRKKMIK